MPTGLFTWRLVYATQMITTDARRISHMNCVQNSMLAFLVAVMHVCMNDSDWVTRGIMITLVVLLLAVTLRVLLLDWGAIAPSSDALIKRIWRLNKTLVYQVRVWIGNTMKSVVFSTPYSSKRGLEPGRNLNGDVPMGQV